MQKEILLMGGAFLAVLMIVIVFIVVTKKEKFIVEYNPQRIEYKPRGIHGYDYRIMGPFAGCADSTDITPDMLQLPEQTFAPSPLNRQKDPVSGYDTTVYTSKRRGVSDFESELMPRY